MNSIKKLVSWLGGGYTVVVLLIAIGTKLTRKHKNN
ncbi:Protein of unknown function [Lactobacillus equicursoris 66c]|uniref:Uncharacterized protein n=1 Tax=Lactobacillus equicursoris 66c TaxID=872326 RepID=K0NR91_9LACO|nr:Protein of unknown function [Lactobacillus equicursoris 66c]